MSLINLNTLSSSCLDQLLQAQKSYSGAEQIMAQKNLCATLNQSTRKITALMGAQAQQTQYGSAALYGRLMQQGVDQLLAERNGLTSTERQALENYKACSAFSLQTAAIHDYYRIRMPCIISYMLAGDNAMDSWIVWLFGWFFLPSSSECQAVAEGIAEKIRALPLKGSVLIAYGNLDHETLLFVEKNSEGVLTVKHFDPNYSSYEKVSGNASQFSDAQWWKEVVLSKAWGKDHPFSSRTSWKHTLPKQKRATCFAQCQWNFLRYFLSKNGLSSPAQERLLEKKLQQRIITLCTPIDPKITAYGRLQSEKKHLKYCLLENKDAVMREGNKLLRNLKELNPTLAIPTHSNDAVELAISSSYTRKPAKFKEVLKTCSQCYALIQRTPQAWAKVSAKMKKELSDYLQLSHQIDQALKRS